MACFPVRINEASLVTMVLLLAFVSAFAQTDSVDFRSWERLTLREKIGQTMLMLPNEKKEMSLGQGSLEGFFARYPVTGFFMGWKLFDGVTEKEKTQQVRIKVRSYQQASKLPLIFQEDYENGVALPEMTPFPNEMVVGAAHNEQLAYEYGSSVAIESRSVGINWVLHPVADLNMNPLNPITNVRSISDKPDKAISLLKQQINGLQTHGVAATIKHFPGDGIDFRDQHLLTSSNALPFREWKKLHGKVFQALIDQGVAAIMPGHITLPGYQKVKINGLYPPATLSKELLTNLLKGEMHFKGVIISDAMVMGGFRGWYPTQIEGEIQSFLAGVDVLLWPSYEFMDTLEQRIIRKEIPMQRLNDAVSRIWALKQRFGILNTQRELIRMQSKVEKASAMATAHNLCKEGVTLIRDEKHLIPLDSMRIKKILIVGVTTESRKGGDGGYGKLKMFQQLLGARGFDVDLQRNILYETNGWEEQLTSNYDQIIFAVVRTPHKPFGPLQLYDDEAQSAWAINAMKKDKVIVVSFGSPYLVNEYFERVGTCINAYTNSEFMHEAVVQVLTGEIKGQGISPVDVGIKNLFLLNH